MTYRNLDRYFCFEKAMVLYKDEDLKRHHIHVLLAVFHVSRCDRATSGSIDRHLRRFYRTLSSNVIQSCLNYLLENGLVVGVGRKPVVYSLTMAGQLKLKELDERVKNTRYDR